MGFLTRIWGLDEKRQKTIIVGVDSHSTYCTGLNNKLEQPFGAGEYRILIAAENPGFYPDYEIKNIEIR